MVKANGRELPKVVLDALTRLERREAELLCWGMVDGFFTRDEVLDVVRDGQREELERGDSPSYETPEAVLDELIAHALLFKLPGFEEERYRSRTAEAVRLFSRLKQLFEGHFKDGNWRGAANLVADYRLILRARQYPKRHIPPGRVHERLQQVVDHDGLSRDVVAELLRENSPQPLELAEFQVEATERVLDAVSGQPKRGGTIVCAGTGSGKTLSFYLPAMVLLARLASDQDWTRCLAIYPRNELLKDQLDSALAQVAALNRVLARSGRPAVTVGALYGAVPKDCDDERTLRRSWTESKDSLARGWLCPYVQCPKEACRHRQLVWLDTDRNRKIERLTCPSGRCNHELDGTTFRLTRKSMQARPPDVLFSGLEMVNQSMASLKMHRLLGIGINKAAHRPRLVLLDEVHTYSGPYGAQAALLLRRWRQATRAAPHFVGLSATLEDAQRFFSDLTGEPLSRVHHIEPRPNELEEDGQEVLLALRGDPVSKSALLSTSIQTAMLLRRVLDPKGTLRSLHGSKVFAFTDDLDVTNRLYHDLLDAEGWRTHFGRPPSKQGLPLASLRAPERDDDHQERFQAGQSWDLADQIGHEFRPRATVHVGRTSSQDAGVDAKSEVVVATASLEVGFDDPEVGAVLQHKAPRSAASFLQRKGRAGRPRGTRPWTVVVLSDFGRDRLAYQGYEQLFSPELRPRFLPIQNRHVLRIQATLSLMDWLASTLEKYHNARSVNLWAMLSQPPKKGRYHDWQMERIGWLLELIDQLMTGGTQARHLSAHLKASLGVDQDTVEQLLWAPPRSLMLSVLPTLRRRLHRQWQVATADGKQRLEAHTFWSPLPEFLPNALFSDLNLPEVAVCVPPYEERDVHHMPILQALREFAPGRVSRRFGSRGQGVQHWIHVPIDAGGRLNIADFCHKYDGDEIGRFRYIDDNGVRREVPCVRPRVMGVTSPENSVKPSSNGFLEWRSQLLPRVPAAPAELPHGSPWRRLVKSIGFFAHGYGSAIEVRRFALGSTYAIRTRRGQEHTGRVAFMRQGEQGQERAALGFAMDADALRLELVPQVDLHRSVQSSPALLHALRAARFEHLVHASDALDEVANRFQRDWLVQCCLSALMLTSATEDCDLEQACRLVFDEAAWMPLEEVLDVIFQVSWDTRSDDIEDEDSRATEIRDLLRDPVVRDVLRESAPALWEAPSEAWEDWLHARYVATLGAAVLEACQHLCPEVDSRDLCVDVDPGVRGPEEGCEARAHTELWLSETTPGGSGVVEALSLKYAADPLRFFRLLEAALAPSDFEEVDTELGTLVGWLSQQSDDARREVQAAVAAVRRAEGHEATVNANESLRGVLEQTGLATTHPVLVAMQARVLRPGSSAATDALLHDLLTRWRQLETRLGVEVDARVMAYAFSEDSELKSALSMTHSDGEHAESRDWRYAALYSLLWPRGATVRSQALSVYNPFYPLADTDRLLVLAVHEDPTTEVKLESEDWAQRLSHTLATEGAAILSAAPAMRRDLRLAMLDVLERPVETEALLVAPVVTAVTQEARRLRVRFNVREGLQ